MTKRTILIAFVIIIVIIIVIFSVIAGVSGYMKSKAIVCKTIYNVGNYIYAKEFLENIELKEGSKYAGGQVMVRGGLNDNAVEYCLYKYS